MPGIPGQNRNNNTNEIPDLMTQEVVTIRFYDENVTPDHEYAYRMRVVVFNPTYRLDMPVKDNPKASEQPVLFSSWAEAKDADTGKLASIKIDPNLFMFVSRAIGQSDAAQFSIYKWDNGTWQRHDESVAPGQQIGRVRSIAGSKEVDFATGYTLVDIQPDGHGVIAILQTPTGQLVVRDSTADAESPNRKKLESAAAPRVNKPAPAGGTGVNPGT